MASLSIYCVGCGCDITNSKGNRLVRTTSSRHVVPLWSSLMKEEIDSRGAALVAQSLIHDDGRMCRQCFNTFERASKLWEALKCNISKAADIFIPSNAPSTGQRNVPPTPKRRRLLSNSEGESTVRSPEVKVSKFASFIIAVMLIDISG